MDSALANSIAKGQIGRNLEREWEKERLRERERDISCLSLFYQTRAYGAGLFGWQCNEHFEHCVLWLKNKGNSIWNGGGEVPVKGTCRLVFNLVIQLLTLTIYPKSWLAKCHSSPVCLLQMFHLETINWMPFYVLGAGSEQPTNSSSLIHVSGILWSYSFCA